MPQCWSAVRASPGSRPRTGCAGSDYRVTVVEVAKGLRKGGTPVDIEGETIGILERMGMIDAVRAKALPPRGFEFKDADDSTIGAMPAQPASHGEKYEIHRDDLLEILSAAVAGSVDMVFGRSIAQLEDGPDGVAVTFDGGSRRDYALVFRMRRQPLQDQAAGVRDSGEFLSLHGVLLLHQRSCATQGCFPPTCRRSSACPAGRRC